MFNRSKGFTLIELMVVISIISLLSSIILASVKEVRDRANITKFKSEVQQLITAMELYKTANNVYPNEGLPNMVYTRYNDNTEIDVSPSFKTLLSPHIKNTPLIPKNNYIANGFNGTAYTLRTNPSFSPSIKYRCSGDVRLPSYVISISSYNPKLYDAFSDWPSLDYDPGSGSWIPYMVPNRCYSPK